MYLSHGLFSAYCVFLLKLVVILYTVTYTSYWLHTTSNTVFYATWLTFRWTRYVLSIDLLWDVCNHREHERRQNQTLKSRRNLSASIDYKRWTEETLFAQQCKTHSIHNELSNPVIIWNLTLYCKLHIIMKSISTSKVLSEC